MENISESKPHKNFNNNKFKNSEQLEQLEDSSENDKSIIDFDDEYSEVSNLYSTKKKNPINDDAQIFEQFEDDQDNYYEYSDPRMQTNSIEKQIINQNLKQLMDIDINDKKGIIDLLMQDHLIQKKDEVNTENNKNKYYYVESKSKNDFSINKKNTYGRTGFQIEAQEGDPEFIKDINVAANILKGQIQQKDENIAKLLFDDLTPNPNTKKILTRKEIGDKVKKALEKKRQNLEKIEAKMYEEQKAEETFTPAINHRKKDGHKRNLSLFLKDQDDFQKKVLQKKQELMIRSESEKKMLNLGHPFIDKNSKELAKRINDNEKVYLRLYKKSKDKDKIKEKINEKIMIEENEKKLKKKKYKNNAYSHIKSKFNILHKTPSQMSGNSKIAKNGTNMTEPNESKYLKKRTRSAVTIKGNKKLFDIKDLSTNKMLWNKFNKNFEDSIKKLNLKKNDNNNEEIYLDENQYHQLLYNLGMVVYELDNKEKEKKEEKKESKEKEEKKENEEKEEEKEKEKEENKSDEKNPEFLMENSLKLEENKIIHDSFSSLKLDKNDNKIKLNDVKNFLIFLLDNQNYDFYHQFKIKHNAEEIKSLFPSNKFKKEDMPDLIIKKYNEELLSEVDKSNKNNSKYFSFSKDNKIIFTLDKYPIIKKDFNLLSLNYRNQKQKQKDDKNICYIKKYPFKPKVNENSEKLYKNYKEKVMLTQNDTNTSNSQIKKTNMEYIDRILLLDKKRIAENQKIKEELEKKQLKECTFRPKINLAIPLFIKNKNKMESNNNNGDTNKNGIENKDNKRNKKRFEELYEKGKKIIQSKKDKTKEEIELEEQINECTFQPQLYNLTQEQIPETKFSNDIYNEKEYKYLYERLKHGRLERMVKDSNTDRYGLSNELKQFIKDNKEYNCIQNQAYFDPDDPYYYNYNDQIEETNAEGEDMEENNIEEENGSGNGNEIENENGDINNKEDNYDENNNEEENDQKEMDDLEKKDDIPLLIIDVNIRQGIKKKIYVYEGDTPEALAANFAKENNLEPETQKKLQSLIHSHMVKLLTRIEEENLSVSEKSQNTNNKKIN